MTLVATFAVASFPLIFGDLLLTGPSSGARRPIATPAAGDVQDFFGDSGWGVAGLRQKVNIVSNECIVAWSGSWLGARLAIGGLRRLSAEGPLSLRNVLEYLQSEPELKSHPASLVGLLFDGTVIHQFQFGAEVLETHALGTVELSGTGARAITEFCELMSGNETGITGEPGAPEVAISHALNLGSLLLQAEFRGGDAAAPIRNMFGGGYEIAYFLNGKAQKLSGITYIFWEAEVNADGARLSLPQLLVKQIYSGDHLLIRSVKIRQAAPDQPPTLHEEQRHIVGPMFESAAAGDPMTLCAFEFTSQMYCHCIATRIDGKDMGIYTKVQRHSNQSDAPFLFTEHNGSFEFSARDDALRELVQSVQRLRQPRRRETDG